jgi:hypothetical protein
MPHLCPWALDTIEYDGCCTHTSLSEGFKDIYENLTSEEIEALETEKQLKNSRRDTAKRGKEDKARGEALRIDNNTDVLFAMSNSEQALDWGDILLLRSTRTRLPGSPELLTVLSEELQRLAILLHGFTTARFATMLQRMNTISHSTALPRSTSRRRRFSRALSSTHP